MNWLCWHVGTHADPKFKLISRATGAGLGDVLASWAIALERAAQSKPRGNAGSLTAEELAVCLDIDEEMCGKILDQFQSRNLIHGDGMIAKWGERQHGNDSVRKDTAKSGKTDNMPEKSGTSDGDPEVSGKIRKNPATGQDNTRHNKQEIDSAFAEFWLAYPLKKSKGQAERAYRKAFSEADAATLLAGAKRYAADPSRKLEFTKHAATWLNGKCWLDETPAQTALGESGGAGTGPVISDHDAQWRARLRGYKPGKHWHPNWGRKPEEGNRDIPPHVLAEWQAGIGQRGEVA